MDNGIFEKGLVCVIVVLFVGISTMPLAGSLSLQNHILTEKALSDCSMVGDSGLSLITVKVISEMGNNGWYTSNVPFVINYESDEIASVHYGLDGVWTEYNGSFIVSEDLDNHVLEWYAVDHEGNKSEIDGPFVFDLDKTKPIVPEKIAWDAYKVDGKWYVTFNVTCTDATSGMDRVEWALYLSNTIVMQEIDGGSGPCYKWTILWSKDYEIPNKIRATAYDKAGNSDYVELWGFGICNILQPSVSSKGFVEKNNYQSTPGSGSSTERVCSEKMFFSEKPKSDCSTAGDFDIASLIVVVDRKMGNNDWIVSDFNIIFIPDPDDITAVYYKLDNGEWILYSEPLVISEEGFHTFWWYILDDEGNTSTPDYIAFNIDQTPPEINLIKKRIDLDEVKFTADVKDDTSGINRVGFYEDDDLVFTDYDFPYEWTYTKFRNEKITAKAYDNAGNSNSSSMNVWNTYNNQQGSNQLFLKMLQRLLNIR